MGWEVLSLSRGFSLDLTGVAPTILRHEGRRPLPPLHMQGLCAGRAMPFPGPLSRGATQLSFRTARLDTQLQFFPGGRAESFPRPASDWRSQVASGGSAHKFQLAHKKENEDTKAKNCGNWVAMLHWPSPPPEGLGYMDANRAKRMKD